MAVPRSKAGAGLTRRGFLKAAQAALWAVALAGLRPAPTAASALPPIIWHGRLDLPYLALTFDDCYLLEQLRALEQLLDARPTVKVTFFPVGTALLNTAAADPDLWKRLMQKGHEIGYHGYRHETGSKLTDEQMLADYAQWLAAATAVLGSEPAVRFARPPFGDRSRSFFNLCLEKSLILTMWSTTWGGAADRAQQAMARAQNGDIVLMHIRTEDIRNTRQALALRSLRSLRFVTLSRLYDAINEYDPRTRQ